MPDDVDPTTAEPPTRPIVIAPPLAAPLPYQATTPPATIAPSSSIPSTTLPPTTPPAEKPKSLFSRWWLWLVVLVVVGILAGVTWYVFRIFNISINADHAEHMQMSPSVHEIQHIKQKLVIGTENTYQPMEFLDAQKSLTGFDIDLAKEIGKEFNVPVEFKMIDFDSVFAPENLGSANVLTNGDVDMLLDSVTITNQRKQAYAFSQAYLKVGQVALVKDSDSTIHAAADLRNKRIAVETSTSNESLALTYTADANVIRVEDFPAAAQAVLDDKADAMLTDLTNAKGVILTHPGLKIATDPLTDESYGIVVSNKKQDLVTEINLILDTLRQRGVLESLRQKWLQ